MNGVRVMGYIILLLFVVIPLLLAGGTTLLIVSHSMSSYWWEAVIMVAFLGYILNWLTGNARRYNEKPIKNVRNRRFSFGGGGLRINDRPLEVTQGPDFWQRHDRTVRYPWASQTELMKMYHSKLEDIPLGRYLLIYAPFILMVAFWVGLSLWYRAYVDALIIFLIMVIPSTAGFYLYQRRKERYGSLENWRREEFSRTNAKALLEQKKQEQRWLHIGSKERKKVESEIEELKMQMEAMK